MKQVEAIYQDVLKSYTAVRADHPVTLSTKNNLAIVWVAQKKHENAESLLLETLQNQKAILGERHPDTVVTKGNLAGVYQAQKKYAMAESLFIEALAANRSQLGAENVSTLTSQNNLAGLYYAQGKHDRAEPLFLDTLQKQIANLGPEHLRTMTTTNNLAGVYFAQKRYAQAEPLFVEVLKIARPSLNPMIKHAACEQPAGRVRAAGNADAEPLRDMLRFRRAKYGPESRCGGRVEQFAPLARLKNTPTPSRSREPCNRVKKCRTRERSTRNRKSARFWARRTTSMPNRCCSKATTG